MIRGVCAVLAAVLALLAGCNQEAPRKTEASRSIATPQAAAEREERLKAGESLFKQYCAPCHPEGGNISDPQRSLRGPVLRATHIPRPEDIVTIMRHPISR